MLKEITDGTLREWPVYKHPTIYSTEEGTAFIRHHALDRSIGELDLLSIQYERSSQFYQPISEVLHSLTIHEQNSLPVNQGFS